MGRHPINKNGVIVFDLRQDPAPLLDLDVDAIRARLFTPVEDLPEGVERIPLKTCPRQPRPRPGPDEDPQPRRPPSAGP